MFKRNTVIRMLVPNDMSGLSRWLTVGLMIVWVISCAEAVVLTPSPSFQIIATTQPTPTSSPVLTPTTEWIATHSAETPTSPAVIERTVTPTSGPMTLHDNLQNCGVNDAPLYRCGDVLFALAETPTWRRTQFENGEGWARGFAPLEASTVTLFVNDVLARSVEIEQAPADSPIWIAQHNIDPTTTGTWFMQTVLGDPGVYALRWEASDNNGQMLASIVMSATVYAPPTVTNVHLSEAQQIHLSGNAVPSSTVRVKLTHSESLYVELPVDDVGAWAWVSPVLAGRTYQFVIRQMIDTAWVASSDVVKVDVPHDIIVWGDDVRIVDQVQTDRLAWSPTRDEYIFLPCIEPRYLPCDSYVVYKAQAPAFEHLNVSPVGLDVDVRHIGPWRPNGEHYIVGVAGEQVGSRQLYETWLTDRVGNVVQQLGEGWMHGSNWLTNDRYLASTYGGGGHVIFTIKTVGQDVPNSNFYFAGGIATHGKDYVGVWRSAPGMETAAVLPYDIPPEIAQLSDELTPFEAFVELRDTTFSRAEAFLPDSNQLILSTQYPLNPTILFSEAFIESAQIDYPDEPYREDIRVWDVETGVVTTLIAGGKKPMLSPAGDYLLYQAQSLDEQMDGSDGTLERALGPSELVLFDIEARAVVQRWTIRRETYDWLNEREFYLFDANGDLRIADVENQSTIVTNAGASFVQDVQMSASGDYLAVQLCTTTDCGDSTHYLILQRRTQATP